MRGCSSPFEHLDQRAGRGVGGNDCRPVPATCTRTACSVVTEKPLVLVAPLAGGAVRLEDRPDGALERIIGADGHAGRHEAHEDAAQDPHRGFPPNGMLLVYLQQRGGRVRDITKSQPQPGFSGGCV